MKTLRELIDNMPEELLDCECKSFKTSIVTPMGNSWKTDYSAVREAKLEKIRNSAALPD